MPAVFRHNGYRFHFFSDEGDPREPVHIHVTKDGHNAKFWLYPDVSLAYNYGFNARDLAALEQLVAARAQQIEEAWNEHFG
jgi:Domain of unknown function (DUF4160)